MQESTFEQIDKARRILGLDETATLDEIKKSYRKLALQYHPDKCRENKKECEEIFKGIANSYELIMKYCSGYRYSFYESDVFRNTIDELTRKHLKQFYDGWWGDLNL